MDDLGVSAASLPGWSVAVTRRVPAQDAGLGGVDSLYGGRASAVAAVGAAGLRWSTGEVSYPVLHAATIPLPAIRGDFGTGVVDLLGPNDAFVALVEYGDDVADVGLFEPQGLPKLAPSQFSPNRLQRAVRECSAAQHFFSAGGRAFCLFAVVGRHSSRMATVRRAAALRGTIRIADRSTMIASRAAARAVAAGREGSQR